MSSRRQFIREASMAAGGFLVASSSLGSFFIGKKPKVIIIGAGFSGLAAAYSLHKRNIDFTILEARNRISGRVFSHTIDPKENLVIELGAEWVGNSHIRLRELCQELKLELENNQFESHLIYQGKYYKNGEWNYSDQWLKKFKSIIANYEHLTQADKLRLDKMDWWRFLSNNGCEGRDLDIRELFDSTDFGESIRDVSAFAALAEYAESSEKNEMDMKIKGGNSLLAQGIAGKIGREKIKLEHSVNRIVQDKLGVKVYCGNGTSFAGDKIICTVPAFAAGKIKWEPGLPADQVGAINELQYARINKNPLLFRERFWKAEDFDMVTDQSPHYFYHATKNQRSQKGVLISYTIGEKAAVVANQSDEWRADMIQQTLQPHFGDVKKLLESQGNYYWGNDPYSFGSYAVYGKGQWFRVRPILARPHIHTHFAGEHLADWQGFMEGAINTGEEAAAII
ncbi:MAG TPA: FAD-dependent oxidoreductase [Chitinophagaceae bacterium]|nr:FAD-dependent oxidoreductase [Chitinophagaceae bacterium]